MDGGWLIYSRGQCLPKCCYYFNGLKMAQLLSTAFMRSTCCREQSYYSLHGIEEHSKGSAITGYRN